MIVSSPAPNSVLDRLRHASSSALLLALIVSSVGCQGSDSSDSDSQTEGATTNDDVANDDSMTDTTSNDPATDDTGTGDTGTDGETTGATDDTSTTSDETEPAASMSGTETEPPVTGPEITVGTFAVEMAGETLNVQGKVKDGPDAANLVWDTDSTVEDCNLQLPRVPSCLTACSGSDVCVEDETCRTPPSSVSVGDVLVEGVRHGGSTEAVKLRSIVKNYQTPADVTWDSPPFAPGDPIELTASGADVAAFEIAAAGVSPIVVTSEPPDLSSGSPIELRWEPESDAVETRVDVRIDISHHGGTRGLIECSTADDGELTIDGALVQGLMNQGISGFPNIRITRSNVGAAQTALGVVELKVNSIIQQDITIDGLASCNTDEECSGDTKCDFDRVCR